VSGVRLGVDALAAGMKTTAQAVFFPRYLGEAARFSVKHMKLSAAPRAGLRCCLGRTRQKGPLP
jgi:hypothetical protein